MRSLCARRQKRRCQNCPNAHSWQKEARKEASAEMRFQTRFPCFQTRFSCPESSAASIPQPSPPKRQQYAIDAHGLRRAPERTCHSHSVPSAPVARSVVSRAAAMANPARNRGEAAALKGTAKNDGRPGGIRGSRKEGRRFRWCSRSPSSTGGRERDDARGREWASIATATS